MLIPQIALVPLLSGRGGRKIALHVGAHKAEERQFYRRLRFVRVDWVEAQPELVHELEQTLSRERNRVFEGSVWGTSGLQTELKITSNSQSTSLLPLGSHASNYPNITVRREIPVTTVRLDELVGDESYLFVNLDIQGAELEALKGMGKLLGSVKVIYTEVNKEEVYESCALVADIDKWLAERGFQRILTKWTSKGWGDAIYIRETSALKIWVACAFFQLAETVRGVTNGVFRAAFRPMPGALQSV